MSGNQLTSENTCPAGDGQCACGQFENCYQSSKYTGGPNDCPTLANNNATITAEDEKNADVGPMQCVNNNNSPTNGCCWWGRGPIAVTGPKNYGNVNNFLLKNQSLIPGYTDENGVCKNPESICQDPARSWISSMHYWMNSVQTGAGTPGLYFPALEKYIKSCEGGSCTVDVSTLVNQNNISFPAGTGAAINQGKWNAEGVKDTDGDAGATRVNNFIKIIEKLENNGNLKTKSDKTIQQLYIDAGITSITDLNGGSTVSKVFDLDALWPVLDSYKETCENGESPTQATAMACSFWNYNTTSSDGKLPESNKDSRYGAVAAAAFLASMQVETAEFATCDEWINSPGSNCNYCTGPGKDSPCATSSQDAGFCGYNGSRDACTWQECARGSCNSAGDVESNESKSACRGGWCPNGACAFNNKGDPCKIADAIGGQCATDYSFATESGSNASSDACEAGGGGWIARGYCVIGNSSSAAKCNTSWIAGDADSNSSAAKCVGNKGKWCDGYAFCGYSQKSPYGKCSPLECNAKKCTPAKELNPNLNATNCHASGGGWCNVKLN